MNQPALRILAAVASLCVVSACGSSSSPASPTGGDSGPSDDAATGHDATADSAEAGDASAEASPGLDAGQGAESAAGCAGEVAALPYVTPTAAEAGTAPTLTGGTITAGTYVLSSGIVYWTDPGGYGAHCSMPTQRSALVFAGDTLTDESQFQGQAAQCETIDYAVDGGDLSLLMDGDAPATGPFQVSPDGKSLELPDGACNGADGSGSWSYLLISTYLRQ